MISADEFRELALSLPHAQEKKHFDRAGFRVDAPRGKMFATLSSDEASANVFLTLEEQEIMCESEPDMMHPVPNKWGEKGATTIVLNKADETTVKSVLLASWKHAAPPRVLKEQDL